MPSWLHTDMARNEAYVAAREAVARARGRRVARATVGAARSPRAAHRAGRRRAAAVGAAERPRAGIGQPVLLDHRLDQRARRSSPRQRPRSIGRARDPAPSAAAAGRQGAAAARESLVGAAVRDLQPRARHAVAQRGRPERAARARRAADVRLHVRRRRSGARDRRRRLRAAQALAAGAPVRRRRRCRGRLRRAVRQRVQPARAAPALDRAARRSADDPAVPAVRRRRAADDRAAPVRRRSPLAR